MKSTTLTVEVAIENEYVRALVLGELWAQIGSRITDFDAYAPTACDLLCGDQGAARYWEERGKVDRLEGLIRVVEDPATRLVVLPMSRAEFAGRIREEVEFLWDP